MQTGTRRPSLMATGLSGRFGRGGMGRVFLGHDTLLDRDVAIKFIAEAGNTASRSGASAF